MLFRNAAANETVRRSNRALTRLERCLAILEDHHGEISNDFAHGIGLIVRGALNDLIRGGAIQIGMSRIQAHNERLRQQRGVAS